MGTSFPNFLYVICIRVRTHWTDNLSSVGALIHSKIFVNHKVQSHGNKHHRLLAVRRKDIHEISGVILTASIEYVASTYYCLCCSFFFFLEFVYLQQKQLLLLLRQ